MTNVILAYKQNTLIIHLKSYKVQNILYLFVNSLKRLKPNYLTLNMYLESVKVNE